MKIEIEWHDECDSMSEPAVRGYSRGTRVCFESSGSNLYNEDSLKAAFPCVYEAIAAASKGSRAVVLRNCMVRSDEQGDA